MHSVPCSRLKETQNIFMLKSYVNANSLSLARMFPLCLPSSSKVVPSLHSNSPVHLAVLGQLISPGLVSPTQASDVTAW